MVWKSPTKAARLSTIDWATLAPFVRRALGRRTVASAWNYYKLEAEAFRSGWLEDLPGSSWLSSSWLRHQIEQSAPAIDPSATRWLARGLAGGFRTRTAPSFFHA